MSMEKLSIEPTLNSPGILMDPEQKLCSFSGESRPENVRNFYMPVLEWLKGYAEELSSADGGGNGDGLTVEVSFEYFNSTSAKYILDVFKVFGSIREAGTPVSVRWHYESDDEDMYEVGAEMSLMSGLDFELVEEEV